MLRGLPSFSAVEFHRTALFGTPTLGMHSSTRSIIHGMGGTAPWLATALPRSLIRLSAGQTVSIPDTGVPIRIFRDNGLAIHLDLTSSGLTIATFYHLPRVTDSDPLYHRTREPLLALNRTCACWPMRVDELSWNFILPEVSSAHEKLNQAEEISHISNRAEEPSLNPLDPLCLHLADPGRYLLATRVFSIIIKVDETDQVHLFFADPGVSLSHQSLKTNTFHTVSEDLRSCCRDANAMFYNGGLRARLRLIWMNTICRLHLILRQHICPTARSMHLSQQAVAE